MSAPPAILKAIDPMSFALHSGVQHRLPALPVVDASGRYAGVLPRSRLMALALPRVLSHDEEKYPPSDLLAAGFAKMEANEHRYPVSLVRGDARRASDYPAEERARQQVGDAPARGRKDS